MGVSFKVSKTGKRFHPKPLELETPVGGGEEEEDTTISSSIKKSNPDFTSTRNLTVEAGKNGGVTEISDNDVSFTLSLFPDGYSIRKPVENNESGHQTPVDVPKCLHPYDRASETLFSAIESGRLPGDILNDLPCKYINGTLLCEVRDYRNCSSETGHVASGDASPSIIRVCLRMSLENLVKDIPSISDDGWTYGDLMEVEARILKALQPQLCLDPSPKLDRLSDNPVPTKLNLAVHSMRRKRLRQIHEATVSSNNKIHGKRVCTDKIPESSRMGDWRSSMQQSVQENLNTQNNVPSAMLPLRTNSFGSDVSVSASSLLSPQSKFQMGVGSPSLVQDNRSGAPLNASIASPAGQDLISLADNGASSVHCKRENQDGQLSPLLSKRGRLTATGVDGSQHIAQQMDSFNGPDSHWKNTLMQQQSAARGYANNSMKKFSQQGFEGGLNQDAGAMPFTAGQQGMRHGLKEEPVETERFDKTDLSRIHMAESGISHIDSSQSRLQQRMPQQFGRTSFPQTSWNSHGQPPDNNSRKEDFQKRKLVQSPLVSAGGLPQSPLSSKSGEFSSSSIGPQFGGAVTSGIVSSQKEKSAVTSVPPIGVGGTMSLTSSANDSVQRQNQAQAAAKRRSNSLPKTAAISGVGSPASVSNMNAMINANSPVGAQLADQAMLERFSKIEMVTLRYQLNSKKNKVDQYPIRKLNTFSAQQLLVHLSSDSNNENLKDETCKMPLSKSLIGGNMNVPKKRILNFVQTERVLQGNGFQLVPKARSRMIMSEKPNDGSVAIHIGEIEEADYWAAEDYLPTLPNTHTADLLAEQFCSLMTREGYHHEDHVQLKPVRINEASTSQLNGRGIPSGSTQMEMQQYSDGVSSLPSNDIAKPSNSGNVSVSSSQNIQGPAMVSPPGNTQVMQISQGLLSGVSMTSRPQQPELLPSQQQQQPSPQQNQHSLMQQQPHYQRSPMMFSPNSMQNLNNIGQNANMQLGAHMANKSSPLQLQLLQHQQQQQQQQQLQPQQQPQMQRKIMGGLGTVGMGNIGNNMVGLGGLNNVMGIGGIRGVGGTGISASMGTISNIGNMTQNPMNLAQASNLSNALRSATFTPAHAALMAKVRLGQNRSNMLGSPQTSISGIAGGRQLHPGSSGLSMLGPSLNRANINQMQQQQQQQQQQHRIAMGAMGPPKLMPGMNLYMNQQQQQLQQQQLQQQQQQQQQQLQLQQQQQMQIQQQQNQQLQQQESASPLQAVLSPPQVGSPSSMGIPHQMNQQQQQQASPQQMSQRTPMSPQLSSGAIHPMSAGNVEACPASPQLSSQTMGSVGSIPNSSMELQGVNKNNTVGNA